MSEVPSGPLITTIIPTYRRPRLLRRAIRSVLAQTYPHFQVCIYDNTSGDETASVVEELAETDPRVRYHCHSENIGAFKNFAYGMERVETPFFSLLSDDDVLLPGFYQSALQGFEKYPEAILSALATIHFDDTGRVWGVPILNWQPGFYPPPQGLVAMLRNQHPEWTAILFRKEVLRKVEGLDEATGAPSDLDFELRIAGRFPIVVSNELGAIFVSHHLSYSSSERSETLWPAWSKMIRNIAEDEQIPRDARKLAEQVLMEMFRGRLFMNYGLASVVGKNWDEALKAAAILQEHFHRRGQALLVRTLARACRRSAALHRLLLGVNAVRKLPRPLMNRGLQKRFGSYARLLELPG
jgi:glycosyltransferase involved in cell wall biosynthesis